MDVKQFDEKFDAICEVAAKEGPSRNIFEPKFEARSQMEALLKSVQNAHKTDPSFTSQVQMARCHHFIGNNMIETEEDKEGFENLYLAHQMIQSCISGVLETLPMSPSTTVKEEILQLNKPLVSRDTNFEYVLEYFSILNTLGLHLASSESPQRLNDAKKILHLAESLYEDWNKAFVEENGPTIQEAEALSVEELKKDEHAKHRLRLNMDRQYTKTLFYLAQAYAPSDVAIGSKYVHLTMVKQLESKAEFNKKDWAENALQLSGYYVGCNEFGRALHCLEAGKYIMPPDKDEETTGRVEWAFGRYYLARLRHYSEDGAHDPPGVDRNGAWFVEFPLPIPKVEPQPAITTFDEAREEFKRANHHFKEALIYFPFDGQCTDHIAILQDQSQLYKAIAAFESDIGRRIAMHTRRKDLLEKIPEQLNPQAYLTTIRQLYFDVGDIYNDILDLRLMQKREGMKEALSDAKINALNEATKEPFQKFLNTFELDKKKVDKDLRVPVFRTMMRLCALHTRRRFKDPKEEYDAIGRAIEDYAKVLKFAEENPMGDEIAAELKLAQEMHKLLPGKQKTVYMEAHRPS